jgi:hypothetical protein
MNDAQVRWRRWLPAVALVAAVAACESALPFLPTAAPVEHGPHERMPASAAVRVDGSPLVASRPVVIRIETPAFANETLIEVHQQIHAEFAVSSGDYRLSADKGRCVLPLTLAPDTETDVTLELSDDGTCTLVPLRQHPYEAFDHATSPGDVSAQVPVALGPDVTMDIRSLDDPPNPVPGPDTVDESGLLILTPVPTGRYEVRLLVSGAVVDTQTVEVDAEGRSERVRFDLPSG